MNEEEKNRLIEALERAGLTVVEKSVSVFYEENSRRFEGAYYDLQAQVQAERDKVRESKASMDALEKAYYQALGERDEARKEANKCREEVRASLLEARDEIKALEAANKRLREECDSKAISDLISAGYTISEIPSNPFGEPQGKELVGRKAQIVSHSRPSHGFEIGEEVCIREFSPFEGDEDDLPFYVSCLDQDLSSKGYWVSREDFKLLPE